MFKSWCRRQGFCNGSNLSHVLMDGGILSVPFDKLNEFYEMYIKAVQSGEKIYVVEQKTDTYNFFVDLDYKSDEHLTFEHLKEVSRAICDRVAFFGGKNALISIAEPKEVGKQIKHGIHINWPKFVVDSGSATALHSHIVSTLDILFPGRMWKDIVDTAVYGNGKRNTKGSGFRMPWSHKKAKHEACEGRGCEGCDKGKVTQGEYKPVMLYIQESKKLEYIFDQDPCIELLHMATLRTQNKNHVVVEGSVREEGSFDIKDTKDIFTDYETTDHINSFIRKNMDGQDKSEIVKIYKREKTYLVSSTSKYCENLGRSHASNHVWFLIEGDMIYQKCFCTCETMKGRKYGYCKNFGGRRHALPDKIYKTLYPNGYKAITFCQPVPKSDESNGESLVDMLSNFIKKYIIKEEEIKVISINKKSKKMHIINTNASCPGCKKQKVQFRIKQNSVMEQLCDCKTRSHNLLDKIVRAL